MGCKMMQILEVQFSLKEVDNCWDRYLGFLVVSHAAGQDTIQSLPQSQDYSNKLNLPAGQFRQ